MEHYVETLQGLKGSLALQQNGVWSAHNYIVVFVFCMQRRSGYLVPS